MKRHVFKRHFLLFLIGGLSTVLSAQTYTTALGARIGDGIGVTLQQRILKNVTIEGIAQTGLFNGKSSIDLLAEYHQKFIFTRRFNFYFGGGFHAGEEKDFRFTGASGIVGLELTIGRLLLSVDYLGQLHFTREEDVTGLVDHHAAISLRYVLIKKKRKKIFKKKKKKKKRKWL